MRNRTTAATVSRNVASHTAATASRQEELLSRIDTDNDGTIDKEEFAVALNRLGVKLGKAQSELVFGSIDEDASGEIDCEEFLEMVFDYKNDGDGDQSSNNTGLAKWSTWVAPKRNASELCGPAASAHLEDTYTVQRRQHDHRRAARGVERGRGSVLRDCWRQDGLAQREAADPHRRG